MNRILLLFPILFPMLMALLLASRRFQQTAARNAFVLCTVIMNSIVSLLLLAFPPADTFTLATLADSLSLRLRVDGLSCVYGSIVAGLWPVTAIYAFDYMQHKRNLRRFYAFFLASYGIAMGIALSANIVTMYLFFELLTLFTLPLVMHDGGDVARYAGKRYLLYSMTGAALGFIAVVMVSHYGLPCDFSLGGTLRPAAMESHAETLRIAYTLAFFGFGVKAALLPMSLWLPAASVAPTPVTALLHAVAVVKAGVFACMRITYYCFGAAFLSGTTAQKIVLAAAILTVAAGSLLALRQNHLKRRLAWSTVSNLSYILLGTALMTGDGLVAASQHMLYHAFIKITLFFAVGAIMEKSSKSYVGELEGMHRRMPVTFACFTVASLALIGIPPLPGFFSKWSLGVAAAETGSTLGWLGVAALMLSALLTTLYLVAIPLRAYFPTSHAAPDNGGKCESRAMNGVLIALCAAIVLLGLASEPTKQLLNALLIGGGIQ